MFESGWADFFAFEYLPSTPHCLALERVIIAVHAKCPLGGKALVVLGWREHVYPKW